ncbi:MAG: hypothetical protein V3T72_18155 [Thermoanaerobaculia bacterium]
MNPIERRHLAVLGILDSSRAWQRSTTAAVDELLRPELAEGETMPDLELLQRLFRRALARRWHRLQDADDRCRSTAHRRRVLVRRLEAARKKLGRAIAGLRAHLADRFGAGTAAELFVLQSAASGVPEELSRQAAHVVTWLRDPAKPLPESPYSPKMEDRRRWAKPVEAAAKALGPALARASRARKQAEAAKAERRRRRGPYDDLFVAVASWFEALYRIAGRDDRAEAVRPSKRRKGLRLSDERQQGVEKKPGTEKTAGLALFPRPPSERAAAAETGRGASACQLISSC